MFVYKQAAGECCVESAQDPSSRADDVLKWVGRLGGTEGGGHRWTQVLPV